MHPEECKVTVGRLSWRPLSFQTQRAISAVGGTYRTSQAVVWTSASLFGRSGSSALRPSTPAILLRRAPPASFRLRSAILCRSNRSRRIDAWSRSAQTPPRLPWIYGSGRARRRWRDMGMRPRPTATVLRSSVPPQGLVQTIRYLVLS
jgi:hypothetical protein